MKTKHVQPTATHTEFRNDLVGVLRKHQGMRPDEMLAVASYFVGQLVAMQDQRSVTPAMAMQVVADNIEAGNRHVINEMATADGGKA